MRRHRGVRGRGDKNQGPIVAVLEAVGCSVYFIDWPFDLLVGYRGKMWLAEVKNPGTAYGRRGLNENQLRTARLWKGPPPVLLETPEQALAMVGIPPRDPATRQLCQRISGTAPGTP